MLHNTFNIIKLRWPEVALVLVPQVGLVLLFEQVLLIDGITPSHAGQIPEGAMFVLGLGGMLMLVVWQMLYLGFLRTAALAGDAPHEPMTLLRAGRPFFWRILVVQFVLGAAMWLVAGLLAGAVGAGMGYQTAAAFPQWLLELAGAAAIALLVKPFFLIPAFMLAMDCSAMEAFGKMRQIRLGQLGPLLKGYAVGLAAIAVAGVVSALAPRDTAVYYIASAWRYGVQSLTVLTLMLATVLLLTPEAETDAGDEE